MMKSFLVILLARWSLGAAITVQKCGGQLNTYFLKASDGKSTIGFQESSFTICLDVD
jgi:hypothetical protein